MRSGLHALISLDGAPVGTTDAAFLGLAAVGGPIAAEAIDRLRPGAVHVAHAAARTTLLLGHFDDPSGLTLALGLPREATQVDIARAAMARHGDDAARVLGGEWSLLDWSPQGVVLTRSLAGRDPLLYARRGTTLAVAPDLGQLARLPWVGRAPDPAGLMFALAREHVRSAADDRTMLSSVRILRAGHCVRFDATGEITQRIAPFEPVAPFRGRFEEAMEQVEQLLRTITRARLARTPGVASMLSGGLDSSLMSLLAAEERDAAQGFACLTSAAPSDSGVPDESGFAQIVADCIGAPLERVVPGALPSIYRPDDADLRDGNGPPLSVRHYLYAAFFARARELGLPLLLDGSYGEMTLTALHPLGTLANRARGAWHTLRGRPQWTEEEAATPFHARLAPHRLAALPEPVAAALARPQRHTWAAISPRARWNYLPGADKMFANTTATPDGCVRHEFLFRDQRLLALFASFPAAFIERGGISRAPARYLMRGRLPDAIRTRHVGMHFSPDYVLRLQAQAPAAVARLPAFRAGAIDDWIDLGWLEQQLRTVAANGAAAVADPFEMQMTAMAAEYLLWWQDSA